MKALEQKWLLLQKKFFQKCEMIIKVKEPLDAEFPLLREGHILFTYLHLAPDPAQTKQILAKKIIGIAYETVTNANNHLPPSHSDE